MRHRRVVRDEHAVLGGEVVCFHGGQPAPHPRVRGAGKRRVFVFAVAVSSRTGRTHAARHREAPQRVRELVRLERVDVPIESRVQRVEKRVFVCFRFRFRFFAGRRLLRDGSARQRAQRDVSPEKHARVLRRHLERLLPREPRGGGADGTQGRLVRHRAQLGVRPNKVGDLLPLHERVAETRA